MSELELALVALGRELELPPTPDLAARVAPRLGRRAPRWRRPLLVAVALAVAALAVALAVPSARSSLLRFFHLRGETIERVETLPPAQDRGLGAQLGRRETPREAERLRGIDLKLPPGVDRVYDDDGVVSVLLAGPVLLNEIAGPDPGLMKKFVPGRARVEPFRLDGHDAIWIHGTHVVTYPNRSPRLAGNVLVVALSDVTVRLEGPRLTRAQAVRIVRSLG